MKGPIKLALILFVVFQTLFFFNYTFGWITVDNVRALLASLQASPRAALWIALLVIAVLAVDSVLAVPTTATAILAGYFLGMLTGGAATSLGLMIAGSICFFGSRYGGDRLFRMIVPDDENERLRDWFEASGGLALIICRALPMLPEVLSCLAGISGMRTAKYYLLFAAGNIPFAFLAAYAGSISSLEQPWPALAVGVGLPALAWVVWYFLKMRSRDIKI